MKKIIIYSLAFIVSIIFSCERGNINSDSSNIDNQEPEVTYDFKSNLKRDFAKAFVQALKDNIELRKLIKDEALKMFNKDYDILYHLVKDKKTSNNKSFRDILVDYFEDESKLTEIESNLPLLTIFVPELPEDSFSANTWDVQNEIPEVAIRMTTTNDVPMFTSQNKEYVLKGGQIPGFPVVVIKENERVTLNNSSSKSDKTIKGSILKSSDQNYEFKFLDDVFNNVSLQKNKNTTKNVSTQRLAKRLDQKIIDAYNIYKNVDGWHRDYIYYNLTPSNTKDPFSYDFKEHITLFRLKGDAVEAYNKISDQTDDPKGVEIKKTINSSSWTGGSFEFKVRILVNAKNGIGSEIITHFPAKPDKLFNVTYKPFRVPGPLRTAYKAESISLKSMSLSLPLFNWDLNQYASTIKIEIEEIDLTTTTVLTDTRSVKFANNFSIEGKVLKKVGLKFGAKLETNTTQTIQKTFTEGNDPLGPVIINFADDIVLGRSILKRWRTRNYQSGWYSISVEPKRVQ